MSAFSGPVDKALSPMDSLKVLPKEGTNSFGHFLRRMEASACKQLRFALTVHGATGHQRTMFKLSGLLYLPHKSWQLFNFERSWSIQDGLTFNPDKIVSRLMSLGFHVIDGEWSDTAALLYLKTTMWMDDSILEYDSVADMEDQPNGQ
jgi:hypothetical protein